ncbi:MAG: HisA/HisF-related TIM barrel protein [Candidatus Lokiarchaeota archaeon]|jgi:phosphoribosylformimino-5-aminoimidazole carboxamide ribotide isomerase
MHDFKVIPVIDILNSKAVHALRGERDKYKPLKTFLCKSNKPIEIIRELKTEFKFSTFYIADLDAITKKKPNLKIISEVSKMKGVEIMIDLGITRYEDILKFKDYSLDYLIIGLETLGSLEILNKIVNSLGDRAIIFSLDMYNEKLITEVNSFKRRDPLTIVKEIQDLGISQIILLDLYKVGQKLGGVSSLYLEIRKQFHGKIYVGGGIKNYQDIETYYKNHFSGVLIATALYDGSIEPHKLSEF